MRRVICIILTSFGAGCLPPKPLVIYTPPSVVVDPEGPRRPPKVVSTSRTFWEAMTTLDTGYVTRHEVTDSQAAFARALALIMDGRPDDAEIALDSLAGAFPHDTATRAASRLLLTAMLQFQDKWTMVADLARRARADTVRGNEMDKAEVESWATAFMKVGRRRLAFPQAPVVMPLLLSASGTPMVSVSVNGKPYVFWLDTGSSVSILASDVAAECGILPLVRDTLEVATATGRVPAQPAAIAKLNIGDLEITNSTAMIVSGELLQVRLGEGSNVGYVKIDGVIGFDIISRLDVRIDYVRRRVTFLKPQSGVRPPGTGRNLFWVGAPVVRVITRKGMPLHFNLDTGASETYATENLVSRAKLRPFIGERRLLSGFGDVKTVTGRFVAEVPVSMGGQAVLLRKLLVFAPAFRTFVSLDGVLGADIGRGGVIRIDATNGLYVIDARNEGLRTDS